jgi:hypothetical protein
VAEDNLASQAGQLATKDMITGRQDQYTRAIMKLEPGIDVRQLTNQIIDDPAFATRPDLREHLVTMAQSHVAGQNGRDTQTYGRDFYALYQRVHLPDGDPAKLTDPAELVRHVGPDGGLSVAGVDRLSQEIQGKRSPEGEAEAEMKRQFFKNARSQISGADDGLHMKDPKGEELFLKFMAQSLPAYEAAKRAGKTPWQMMDPTSPDYLGKVIPAFVRPLAQRTADMMAADPDAVRPVGDKPPLDLSSPQGVIQAVQSGRISRTEGEKLAVERGYIRRAGQGPAPAPGQPEIPMSR